MLLCLFFFSSRRRHTRYWRDWSSDVCSSDLCPARGRLGRRLGGGRWDRGGVPGGGDGRDLLGARRRAGFGGLPRGRKSVVEGKSVDLGGRRIIKKKKPTSTNKSCYYALIGPP